jgi:hypothetical protein
MGWDGTLWGIDAQGAPHVYDSINDAWAPHGDGIDAIAMSFEPGTPGSGGQVTLYAFQGPNVVAINPDTLQASPPTTIAALWPNLPDSFKLGVSGAMSNDSGFGLILFNGGRYISTDGTVPLGKLTDLANWPQTPIWKDGVIDGASEQVAGLWRSGEYLHISIRNKTVVEPPQPFSVLTQYVPMPAAWATSGIDGWTFLGAQRTNILVKGTAVFAYNNDTKVSSPLSYLGNTFVNWPATWHPVLAHAPNGRDGNLWSVLPQSQGGWTVQHNGDSWVQLPNQADHVGVGQDNTVMLASAQRLWKFTGAYDGTGFTPLTPPSNLIQVSLGNANAVYARDVNNNVYSFDPTSGALTPNATVGAATHIAAAYDGALWHAKPTSAGPDAANMHRYLSGPNVTDAIPVKSGVSTVTKVAATGFGSAHCLVQQTSGPTSTTPTTAVYRYDTPFVFKTAGSYFSTGKHIEEGLGRLYMTVEDTDPTIPGSNKTYSAVLVIDPHTGKELVRTASRNPDIIYTTPVFDRVHNLLFVGAAPFDPRVLDQPGAVLAMDPVTLAVKWVINTDKGVDVAPTLIQNDLYFADRGAKIYKVDIGAATANPVNITPTWTAVPPLNPQPPYAVGWGNLRGVSQFAFYEDSVYCTVWDIGYGCHWQNNDPFSPQSADWISQTASFLKIKVADGTLSVRNPPEPIPPGQPMAIVNGPIAFGVEKMYAFPPLFVNLPEPEPDNPNRTVPVLYVNGGFSVFIYALPNGNPDPQFADGYFVSGRYDLPGGLDPYVGIVYTADLITTGFAYDDGTRASPSQNVTPSVWFGAMGDPITGSAAPLLFSVNTQLKAQNGTPHTVTDQPNTLVRTTPVLYKDSTGDLTVFFGLSDAGNAWFPNQNPDSPALVGLFGYAPTTGIQGAIETGTTQLTVLSRAPSSGVIYGTGSKILGTEFAQVFGIRVDQLVQDERDFIIEAELMQDYDSSSPNSYKDPTNPKVGAIPPSFMRYKAHITVVDDNKLPRPKEPVKVWCDTPGTIVNLNGKNYTVGPDDDQYALVQTDVDGVVVLSAGNNDTNTDSDGNRVDQPDINAAEFRVWAGFMDPYERIIVFLDQSWHERMTNATNDYNDNGKNPDPDKPNLSTVRNLKGEPLFDADDRADDAPQKVANSIAQMKQATNAGQSGAASLAGALKTLHASNSAASYVAYSDLPGMHYSPNNALSRRPAVAVAPMGMAFSRDPKTKKSTLTSLTHTDASNQMDALTQGVPRWDPDNPAVVAVLAKNQPQGAHAVLSKRKNGFEKLWDWIKQGLADIENVLVSVTDTVLTTISMILPDGARQVFQWIAQGIEDVVHAIGMIINMFEKAVDDIIDALGLWTFFDEWFNTQDWLTTQINYLLTDFAKFMVSDIKPIFDTKLDAAEDAITTFFDNIKKAFDGQSITNLQGANNSNNTPHTVFTAGTPEKSHAVACMDSIHTLKTQLRNAKPMTQAVVANSGADDPVLDFITTFISSLGTNADLSKAISDVKSDVGNLFTAQGLANLMTNAMDTIIDIIKLLVVGAVAVTKAFFDGLIIAISDFINDVVTALNQTIEIPILSELYQFLFDQPLTLLNVFTLIGALVINIVYRAIRGKYPSQDGVLSTNITRPSTSSTAVANGRRMGIARTSTAASPLGQMIIGVLAGIGELLYGVFNAVSDGEGDDAPAAFGPAAVITGMIVAALEVPWISKDDPDEDTLALWACLSLPPSLLAILGLKPDIDSGGKKILSFSYALFALINLGIACKAYTDITNPKTSDKLNIAIGVCSNIPSIVNPATNLEPYGPPAVAIIDVLGYGIAGGCMIAEAILIYKDPNSAVRQYRLHFPWVAYNPVPSAHPRVLALGGAMP